MGRTRDYFSAYGMDEDQFNALPNAARVAFEAMATELEESLESKCSLKLSAKGAISLRGLGRFPVSLYANQWDAVLKLAARIKRFAQVNATEIETLTGRAVPESLLR